MTNHVHIICAEVPWPADHSMAIDTFCQLKELFEKGVKIHLHYFCGEQDKHPTELNRYCESIHPYNKLLCTGEQKDFHCSEHLILSLKDDRYPVIFEGLHCTGTLNRISGTGRRILVRMYDDECRNCEQSAKYAAGFLQKIKGQQKARRIQHYEKSLPDECLYIFSSAENARTFIEQYGFPHVTSLPLLHPFREVTSKTGTGHFCLYHGDLSDPFNDKAAQWLLAKVFNDISVPLVIAGKAPGKRVQNLSHLYAHTCLVTNPSEMEIEDLVGKAQVHVLPSFSYKRPELKLIHALHSGRHCVVNENAVEGTGLVETCYTGKNANAFKSLVLQLIHKPFEEEEILLRERILPAYNSRPGISKLISYLYD